MKVGSMGYFFEGADVEWFRFRSSRTLLDFDVVLWDAGYVLGDYSTEPGPYKGKPVVREHDSAAVESDVARRRRELEKLCELGKVIVVFAPETFGFFAYTGEERNLGTPGRPRIESLVREVRLSEVLPMGVDVVEAAGSSFQLVAGDPFASFWRSTKGLYAHRARLEGELQPLVTIRGTDYPVAGLARVGDGLILFLPDFAEITWVEPDEEDWHGSDVPCVPAGPFVAALQEFTEQLKGTSAEGPPEWTADFQLPGENKLVAAKARHQKRAAAALQALDDARSALEHRRRLKLLFSGTGEALEVQVRRAFETLGCSVGPGPPGRTDLVLRHGERAAVVEVKGLKGSASERNATQLEKWVAEYYDEYEEHAKGILVVNALRNQTDMTRRLTDSFPDQMLDYAVRREHCLVTSLQLLGALLAAEVDRSRAPAIVESLFSTSGPWPEFTDWEGYLTSPKAVELADE